MHIHSHLHSHLKIHQQFKNSCIYKRNAHAIFLNSFNKLSLEKIIIKIIKKENYILNINK